MDYGHRTEEFNKLHMNSELSDLGENFNNLKIPVSAFVATVGHHVGFVDCNKDDLCLSFEDLKAKIDMYNPMAVWVVHIGGHIAFEIEQIANLCKEKGVILLEDGTHSHGSFWKGKKPGSWGDVGIYSFYATKTISTGEGGMLVTGNNDLIEL